jgi:hypothetical protein
MHTERMMTDRNAELGDKNNQEIHVRTIRGNTTITDLANVAANNLRSSASLIDRRRVEIRHHDNRLSVLLNDVLLVNNVNTGLSNLFVNGAGGIGSGAVVVGFSAGTNLAGDGHDIFNFTMTNVQTPRGDDDDDDNDNPVCTIPLPFLGPILCFIIQLLLALF